MWDVMIQCLGIGSGPPQGVWDESYKYGSPNNPNVRQNLEDIKNLKQSARALWDGAIELFLPDNTPTLKELEQACWNAGHLLMAIDESDYEELYDLAKIDINDWRDRMGQEAEKDLWKLNWVPDPKDGDKAAYIINLYRDAIKNIKEGAAECQAGNIKSGTAQFVWGVVEFHMASTYMYSAILPKELQEILPK